jgi:hypothetical protein
MPTFKFSKSRFLLSAFVSLFLALISAGPGTLILLVAAPGSVNLLGKVVCPAPSRMEARWVRYIYSKPGESNLEVVCVGGGIDNISESRPRWFLKLIGFYFVLFLLPLLYVSVTSRVVPRRTGRPIVVTPDMEVEVRGLLAEGRKTEAVRLVRKLADTDLKSASDSVEALSVGSGQTLAARPFLERLKEVREMLDAGLITEQEYETKKDEILSEL